MNILRNKFKMGKICFLAGAFSFLIFGSGFALNAEEIHRSSFKKNFFQHSRHPKRQNLRSGKSERKPPTGGRIFSTAIRPSATATGETKLTESCFIYGLDWYGSKIIFSSSKNNDFIDIFSIPSSGGSMTDLTNEAGPEFEPKFSNNGTKIYYSAYKSNSDGIWKMDSDGNNKTLVKQVPTELGEFCINPNETKIAYTLDDGSLWVMNSDGTNNTELAEAETWEGLDFSRDGNYIVFVDTNSHISKINITTKELTQLTTNYYYSHYPDWSPTEDKIVFSCYDASWQQDIYVMNSDGTGKTNLTNLSSGYPYNPKYSPDGTKIAYTLEDFFWVMNADGSNKIKIADVGVWDSVWSPDSSKIAYSDSQNIFIVNSDGTNEQNITNNSLPGWNESPCWSGDYTKIVYIAAYSEEVFKLTVMNSDGSSKKELDSVYSYGRNFSFAPHSTKIVYTSIDTNIYLINYDGTQKQQLTTDGQSSYPSWSPDLTEIAYYSSGYLKIMDADGSNQTSLTETNYNYAPPSWSSDGTEIVYLAGYYDNYSVWIVNVLSPSQKTEVVSGNYANECYPVFSPNGTKIAYSIEYDYNNPDNNGLWVINRDDSSKAQIYSGEMSYAEKPVWAGNDRIYFASDYSILSVKSDGSDLKNESTFKWNFAINPSDGSNIISSAFDIFSGIQSPVSIYSVSGYAKNSDGTGISGVTVLCTGESSYTTSSSGYYVFTNLTSGNYTVTPSKTGLVFIPSSRSYSPLNSNQSSQNFTGGTTLYCINGSVKDDGGNAMRDVVLSVTGDAAKDYETDSSGNYEIILSSGNYTITPSKSKWSFTPVSRSYSPLNSDQTSQDYIGIYTVSGNTVIFSEDFESSLGAEWSTYQSNSIYGRNEQTSYSANSGNYSWRMDVTSPQNYNLNELVMYLNVSNASDLYLKFNTIEYSDEQSTMTFSFTGHENSDGIAVSNDGVNWNRLWRYPKDVSSWTEYGPLDIGSVISVSGDVYIKFQQYDNYTIDTDDAIATDGILWDDIEVSISAAVNNVLISGYICDSLSNGISEVSVGLSGYKIDSYTTSNNGYYEFVVSKGNSYTVTPSKSDWVFTPLSKNYFSLSSNQSSQNFTGYEITMQEGKVAEVRGGVKGYIKKGESASIILNPGVSGTVKIKIYNLKGQLVWDETKDVSAGVQDIVSWACKNTSNKVVASGIYIVYIKGAGIDVKKKIAVVK